MAFGQGLSLKARAIGLLSRREYSRNELRRRLVPHCAEAAELDALLDELEQSKLLSNQRFAESLVNRRAAQHGSRRIAQELRKHGVSDDTVSQVVHELQGDELERARSVWEKRFGTAPTDAKEYARQFRFLAARGFPADSLRRILSETGAPVPDLPPEVE